MRGLYVHIPFCQYICHYCDFVKRIPKNSEMIDTYLDQLIKEIKNYESMFDTIETIYIGGGTPSMLESYQMIKLFEALKTLHPKEYTIEVNPESYTHEKGLLFKKYGINRVSIGVQTFNQELLHYLNRGHKNEDVYHLIKDLKDIGIHNLSVDLIYAIPGQTIEMLKTDLAHVQRLDIKHVSAYSLILEEKTYFYHQYLKGNFNQVDEDLEANMYEFVTQTLKDYGYEHYEISNYAKDQLYSKHNMIYWTLEDYIGVGLGAHGLINHERTYNERSLASYLIKPQKEKVFQDEKTRLQDEMIFGLRKIKGIHIKDIEEKYNINLYETYPQITEKMRLGLLEEHDGYLRLTNRGLLLGNQVFMVFI